MAFKILQENHASLSENEADSEEDVSSKKPPLLSRSDREDGICDENTDEDADDEESIGPGIEDKDIEWRTSLVFTVYL